MSCDDSFAPVVAAADFSEPLGVIASVPPVPAEAGTAIQTEVAAPVSQQQQSIAPTMSPAACAQRLKALFPALFSGAPKPLKLRIQADIQERAPGVFSKQILSTFFRRHTGATSYLIAVSKSKHRFDLDGAEAGELSEEHRQIALQELARRRANHDASRAQEMAQQVQEEEQRRNRFNLLRAFESTTLTPSNFCALKGVAPEALDDLLTLARQEAAQRAQHAPMPNRNGPASHRDQRDARGPRAEQRPGPRPAGQRGDQRRDARQPKDGPR